MTPGFWSLTIRPDGGITYEGSRLTVQQFAALLRAVAPDAVTLETDHLATLHRPYHLEGEAVYWLSSVAAQVVAERLTIQRALYSLCKKKDVVVEQSRGGARFTTAPCGQCDVCGIGHAIAGGYYHGAYDPTAPVAEAPDGV